MGVPKRDLLGMTDIDFWQYEMALSKEGILPNIVAVNEICNE